MQKRKAQTPDTTQFKLRKKQSQAKKKLKGSKSKISQLNSISSENYSLKSPESAIVYRNNDQDEMEVEKQYEQNLIEFGMSADEDENFNLELVKKQRCELKNAEEFFIKIDSLEDLDEILKKCRIYVFLIILGENQNMKAKLESESAFDEKLSDSCDFLFFKLGKENEGDNPLLKWNEPPMYLFYVRRKLACQRKLDKNWIENFNTVLEGSLIKERKKSEIERKRSGSDKLIENDFLLKNPWLQDHFCDQELMLLFKNRRNEDLSLQGTMDSYLCDFAMKKDKIALVQDLASFLAMISKSESPNPYSKGRTTTETPSEQSNGGSVFTFQRDSGSIDEECTRKKISSFCSTGNRISEFSPNTIAKGKKSAFAPVDNKKTNDYKFPSSPQIDIKQIMNTSLDEEAFWMMEGMIKAIKQGQREVPSVLLNVYRELQIEESYNRQVNIQK